MIYLINNTTHIFWKGEKDNTRSLELTKLFIIMAGEVTCLSAVTDEYKNSISHSFKSKNVYQITGAAYLTSISLLFIINKISLFIVRCFNYKKLHSDLQSQHSDLQKQCSELQEQLSESTSKLKEENSANNSQKRRISELNRANTKLYNDITSADYRITNLKIELQKNRVLKNKTTELLFIKRELQTLKQTKTAADCKAQELQRGLIRANTRIQELKTVIEQHNPEHERTIRKLNNRIRHLEIAINTLKEERKEKTATINELNKKIAEQAAKKEKLDLSDAIIYLYKEDIEQLNQQLSLSKDSNSLLQKSLDEVKQELCSLEFKMKERFSQRLRHLALGYEEEEDIPKKTDNLPPWTDEHLAYWMESNQLRDISDLQWKEDNIPSQALAQHPTLRQLSREEFLELEAIDVVTQLNDYFVTFSNKFDKETINNMKYWLFEKYTNSIYYDFTLEADQAPKRMEKSLQKLFYIIKKKNIDSDKIFRILDVFFDAALTKCAPTWIKVSEEEADNLIAPLDLKDFLLRCVKNIKISLIHTHSSKLNLGYLSSNAMQWHAEGFVVQFAGKELGIPQTVTHEFDSASNLKLTKEQKIAYAISVFKFASEMFTKNIFAEALPTNIEMLDLEETQQQIDTYLYNYLFPDSDFSTLKWNLAQNLFFDVDTENKRTLNTIGAKALLEHIGYA